MKLAHNVGWSLASIAVRVATTAVALVLQARLLGPDIFGQFAFATSMAALASIVIDYGLSLRILRTLPTSVGHERARIIEDLRLKNALMIPYVMLGSAMIVLLSHGALLEFACIFSAAAANAYGDYGMSVLRGLRRYPLEAVLNTIAVTLHACIVVTGVIFFRSLIGAAFSLLISRLVYLTLVAIVLKRTVPRQDDTCSQFELIPALKRGLPYAQDVIISGSLSQLDMLIAGLTLSPASLALYAIANRCFLVVDQGLGALANVFVPSLSAVQQQSSKFNRMSAMLMWLVSGAGCAGALAAIVIGPWLVISVLGAAYTDLLPHIPLIAIALLTRLAVTASAVPIVALGKQPTRVRCQVIGLAVLLIGAWPAVHAGGLDGLIAIITATYGCIALLQFIALERAGIRAPRLAYFGFVLSLICDFLFWLLYGR